MKYLEIFEFELKKNNLNWCKGCNASRGHKRGFVLGVDKSTIHFDSKICTRSTLMGAFHEMGHCLNNEKGLRSFEIESNAEEYAKTKLKEYNIAVPRKRAMLGVDYIKRKKRHGNNIIRGRIP